MLHETGRGRRRLFKSGDLIHPDRTGKRVPRRDEIPERYWKLLDWYENEYNNEGSGPAAPGLRPDGSRATWLRFVGYIEVEDLEQMRCAIEEQCERLSPDDNAISA